MSEYLANFDYTEQKMKLADKSAENSNLFTFTKGILNGRGPRFKSLRGSIVNPNIFIQWSMK